MKASELRDALDAFIAAHGDAEIGIHNEAGTYGFDIESIEPCGLGESFECAIILT